MARFLNSKLITGFLLIFLSLFVSNTWAAATVEGAKSKSIFEEKGICSSDDDCKYPQHCYVFYCVSCNYPETWDSILGECRDKSNGNNDHWHGSECITCESDESYDIIEGKCKADLDDGTRLAAGIIVVLALVIPVIIIASICACCCRCARQATRQRRDKNNQMQMQPQTVFVQQQHPGYPGQYGNYGPPNAQAQPQAYSPPNHGLYPQQQKY